MVSSILPIELKFQMSWVLLINSHGNTDCVDAVVSLFSHLSSCRASCQQYLVEDMLYCLPVFHDEWNGRGDEHVSALIILLLENHDERHVFLSDIFSSSCNSWQLRRRRGWEEKILASSLFITPLLTYISSSDDCMWWLWSLLQDGEEEETKKTRDESRHLFSPEF